MVIPEEDALPVVGEQVVDDLGVGSRCSSVALRCDSACRGNEVRANILISISAIFVRPVSAGFIFSFEALFLMCVVVFHAILSWSFCRMLLRFASVGNLLAVGSVQLCSFKRCILGSWCSGIMVLMRLMILVQRESMWASSALLALAIVGLVAVGVKGVLTGWLEGATEVRLGGQCLTPG